MLTRVVTSVVVFVIGVLVGTVGTTAHQSVIAIAGIRVPWGVVVAAIAVTSLLVGLRMIDESRLFAIVGSVGVLLVVGLFSMAGPGGSVMIPENPAGIAWLATAVVVSALVITWPRVRLRRSTRPE